MIVSHRQKLTIFALLSYWPILFYLAHRPIPQLVYRAHVSDKTLHLLAYLILAFLLWFAVSPDKRANWRKATVWWVFAIAMIYGAVDEVLQGYVGRNCDAMDFLADAVGVFAGLILFSFLAFWPAMLVVTAISIFLLTNLARANLAELVPVTNLLFHLFAYTFFTLLWIRHIAHFYSLKAPKTRWLITASALPTVFLLSVKLFSIISGRIFATSDIIISVLVIVIVVMACYLPAFYAKRGCIEDRQSKSTARN